MHSDPELDGMIMCIGETEKMGVAEWLDGQDDGFAKCQAACRKKHAKAQAEQDHPRSLLFPILHSLQCASAIIPRLCNFSHHKSLQQGH